jgi:hypothetical protein
MGTAQWPRIIQLNQKRIHQIKIPFGQAGIAAAEQPYRTDPKSGSLLMESD